MNEMTKTEVGQRTRLILYTPAVLAFASAIMWAGPAILVTPILALLIVRALWLLVRSPEIPVRRRRLLVLLNCVALVPAVYFTVAVVMILRNPFPNGL
jgi:hypothetical protein